MICNDTSQVGGPHLLYDHQMCIDVDKQTLYIFGGRIVSEFREDEADCQYSGLFSYHISTNTWTQILVDCNHPTAASPHVNSIKSRVTHAMLFHPVVKKCLIFIKRNFYNFFLSILEAQKIIYFWRTTGKGIHV